MHTKTEGNTFTKEIGQTVYGVRYYFNEDAKEKKKRGKTELEEEKRKKPKIKKIKRKSACPN